MKPSVFHEGLFWKLRQRKGGAWSPEAGWATAMNRFRVRSWQGAGWPHAAAVAKVTAEDLHFHGETFRKRRAARNK